MLARFPTAQAIAVDMDPVMLALGQGALGTAGGRLRWVDADLTSADWTHATGVAVRCRVEQHRTALAAG